MRHIRPATRNTNQKRYCDALRVDLLRNFRIEGRVLTRDSISTPIVCEPACTLFQAIAHNYLGYTRFLVLTHKSLNLITF
ncbi:hypothetical protein ARTHRO_50077 [Limnospira indica PCC 8005]|uniref:Uncharacterized protein n=1 Tax=Limnospira indica PCC 8005 TaxID=376219 RepID=A0A9P1KHH6_9CYAN|nr:hypothetical protein ARTHRO_50077 [Limnospira indica PCC 8005]